VHQLAREAGRRPERREPPPGPGSESGLLLELARCGVGRVLDGAGRLVDDVQAARRDLPERSAGRGPPLADEDDPVRVVDRDDRDGSRMAGDVALVARPVGPFHGVPAELALPAAMEHARIYHPLQDHVFGRADLRRAVGRAGVAGPTLRFRQAATVSRSEVRLLPVSASKRWSFE
jgi:hypothetical protein